ncbi:MAG: flagellar biosynthesis protein FlhB [Lachnospiraceae bacterium]|nr:flagellar biosynthesis protein FlhB [Lachnospiraceae bacterium]
MLELNLQFFAEGPNGEKTEQPTAKKKDDARKEGQVAKSKEINNAFSLLAAFLILKLYTGLMGERLVNMFRLVLDDLPEYLKNYDGKVNESAIHALLHNVFFEILIMMLPIFGVVFLVSFICDLAQVKWRPTAKPLKPKGSKLDPIKGFKKIFSARSLVELLKSILKIFLISYVAYSYLKNNATGLFLLYDVSLNQGISTIGNTIVNMGIRIATAYLIIAFADYAYQRWKHNEDLKMTKQEVKDEYKQAEGDPQIKGKIKQRMMEASRRRMMQAVPSADVVITNPTHYAVAIKYDAEKYDAPVVLAKGADYVAGKIKEVARENDVEIVENKPLARMLYANVEIGEMVPPELYQAVAEVLALVYKMKGKI